MEGTHLRSESLQPAGMEAAMYRASIVNDLNTKLNGTATQPAAGTLCSARRSGQITSRSGAGSSPSRQQWHQWVPVSNRANTPAVAWPDPDGEAHRRR